MSELGRTGAHEIDRMVADTRRMLSQLSGDAAEPKQPVDTAQRGYGTAADELVRAEVSTGGRLEKVTIEPKAMRMDSQTLGEQITAAVRAAQDDLLTKLPTTGALPRPDELGGQLDEVQLRVGRQLDVFGEQLEAIVRKLDQRS
ncbi:YbaB/EbfC family nucleoid-associated protein [Fodinicola acaciae]|uniref:YbaB/EbfC family nucleoid-associated protein n=1 Tax=Fodinicola acaciae TaxID=2681555 RepID=UPI0013D1C9C1|nr:YbaB/EbfC family nucleoid-associated protein [Fodinicola acaciae]